MCPKDEQNSNSQTELQCRKRVLGFDAKNKDILESYICYICNLILRHPHQLSCGHRYCQSCLEFQEGSIIKCNQCDEETLREKSIQDMGCQRDMEKLNITCSLCEWTGIFKNYQEHLNTEHLSPFCEYCGEEFNSVDSLNQHTSTCEMVTIECLLKPYGCRAEFPRMNAQEHFLSEQHQTILLQRITQRPLPSISDSYDQQLTTSYTTISNENSYLELEQINETIDLLADGIKSLSDDTQQLYKESNRYQNTIEVLSEEYSKVKVAVQETNLLLDAQKSNQQMFQQNLASLQHQMNDMKNTSYDGTYIWKITNFQQVITDAKNERQTSIYSPAFYSSPNGYKMRARLYPCGDGNARNSHLSLFFVLMRGDYDAILQFPFTFKVSFCLFDQTSQQRHVIDSFRPDPKSNSFQRPSSDMNIASGIPKFFPLAMIQQDRSPYLCDDTMIIKIVVDFGNLPKTILPYTFSINHGLPLLIQRELIQREVEKRARTESLNTSQKSTTIQHEVTNK